MPDVVPIRMMVPGGNPFEFFEKNLPSVFFGSLLQEC